MLDRLVSWNNPKWIAKWFSDVRVHHSILSVVSEW
jgi:hypothetical protein